MTWLVETVRILLKRRPGYPVASSVLFALIVINGFDRSRDGEMKSIELVGDGESDAG